MIVGNFRTSGQPAIILFPHWTDNFSNKLQITSFHAVFDLCLGLTPYTSYSIHLFTK